MSIALQIQHSQQQARKADEANELRIVVPPLVLCFVALVQFSHNFQRPICLLKRSGISDNVHWLLLHAAAELYKL
jgi:hypothetical protein